LAICFMLDIYVSRDSLEVYGIIQRFFQIWK
jgi:hypothetical protein